MEEALDWSSDRILNDVDQMLLRAVPFDFRAGFVSLTHLAAQNYVLYKTRVMLT